MGHKEKCDAEVLLQQLELALHFDAQVGIERRERLVEQQHFGAIDQRPRQRHSLLLSSADLPGKVFARSCPCEPW